MRVPVSWLGEYVALPADVRELYDALIAVGLEVETVTPVGHDVKGVVVGEVVEIEELTGFKKPIRYCQVRTADGAEPQGVICGATNFAVGDRVPVAVPGAVLPGGFEIGARSTYGRVSNGMICSLRELGIGEDHSGILVLEPGAPIGADFVEWAGLRDHVLDIAVTPDRGYTMSIRGIAREAATALGVEFRDPAAVDVAALEATATGEAHPGRIEDPTAADRFVLRTVSGVDANRTSPLWLRRRLHLSGYRPIALAVDVTNYLMHELGQPLHAFDQQRLSGTVRVRRAAPGEKLETLDHVVRDLHAEDVLIAHDGGSLSMAGTMGGVHSEVAPDTRDVVIEAAHFTPAGILRMSRRHGLVSESSLRFERGVDPELPPYASAKAAMMLVELGGGVYGGVSEVDFPRERPAVTLRAALPGEVVGVPYDRDTVVRRLTDVGCEVVGAGADTLTVTSPTWRTDLLEPYDLVEEVARLEGYDAIPAVLPVAAPGRGWTEEQRRRQAVSRALAAAGYVEVLTVPFHSRGVLDALAVPVGDPRRQLARLANPLSEEAAYLRTTLLPGLVEALRRNLGRGSQDVLLYELGTVFRQGAERPAAPRPPVTNRPDPEQWAALEAALPEQPWHAAAILAGHAALPGWWGAGRVADWSDAVQAGRTLAAAAGVPVEVHQAEMAPWHPGRCAAFTIGGQVVGYAGELHPKVVDALDLPRRTCALEIDLSAVLAVPRELASTPLVSPFPVATQDVALVVDSATPAAAVEAALRDGAGELLESLRLFDVYAGPQLGEGRKSLAYTLRFRAADRTLTAEEATAARDAAVAEATTRTGATLRA